MELAAGKKAAAGLLSVAPVESLSLTLIRQEVGVRRLMPRWVRGRNVVQFPFRTPPLEVKIPMVVSGQLHLTIDLSLKGHMDHKELVFHQSFVLLYTSVIAFTQQCVTGLLCNVNKNIFVQD